MFLEIVLERILIPTGHVRYSGIILLYYASLGVAREDVRGNCISNFSKPAQRWNYTVGH